MARNTAEQSWQPKKRDYNAGMLIIPAWEDKEIVSGRNVNASSKLPEELGVIELEREICKLGKYNIS